MQKYSYYSAYTSRKDLKQFDSCGLTLFALQLFFGIEDVTAIATDDVIVDGPDDGGLDLVYIDKEQKFVVIAQEYEAKTTKKRAASSKKARDLSSGLSLLFDLPIKDVPKGLQSSAEELRKLVFAGEIEQVHIWYVHNLPGSKNVQQELKIAKHTALALLRDTRVKEIKCLEVCAEVLEKRYKSFSTPILVNETYKISISGGVSITGNNWEAFVTSIPLYWFHEQFKNHGTNLFSANVRDYLGILKRSDKNINNGIQETAQNDPEHFWVFNNGITALVHDFKIDKDTLEFSGFSILNGAQTTGAIGNLTKIPNKKALVQVRFVKCSNEQTIINIKRFNNIQNKIEAPDFRSKDSIQERLLKEFKSTDIQYLPRRGGIEDIIQRKPNSLPSVLAGQVLSAFHGRPDIAYHQKTEIWENDALYAKYFNEDLKANHLIFAYSLFEAVRRKKLDLNKKNKNNKLKKLEEQQLDFFQTRGSVFLLTAAVASCLEIVLDKSIVNNFELEFKGKISLDDAVKEWTLLLEIVCSFLSYLKEGFSEGAVREKQAEEAIRKVSELVSATKEANKEIFSTFTREVKLS